MASYSICCRPLRASHLPAFDVLCLSVATPLQFFQRHSGPQILPSLFNPPQSATAAGHSTSRAPAFHRSCILTSFSVIFSPTSRRPDGLPDHSRSCLRGDAPLVQVDGDLRAVPGPPAPRGDRRALRLLVAGSAGEAGLARAAGAAGAATRRLERARKTGSYRNRTSRFVYYSEERERERGRNAL